MRTSLQSALKEIDQLNSRLQSMVQPSIKCDFQKFEFTSIDHKTNSSILYKPFPTTLKFHQSKNMVKLIMGPYGSGKSSACCAEIVFQAVKMPPDETGVRRSNCLVVRNTSGELQTTSLRTWLEWAIYLGTPERHVNPVLRYEYRFNDGNGMIELEVLFLALDRAEDVEKIKSLNITCAWVNELSEINHENVNHLFLRCGRFPKLKSVAPFWYGILTDTNPSDKSSWIYRDFDENPVNIEKLLSKDQELIGFNKDLCEPAYKVFHQPPGLLEKDGKYTINPAAENIENLPGGGNYYLIGAIGKSKEFISVYCMGEYGISFDGELVFKEFNPDIHCRNNTEADPNHPIILGWDFGLTPACLLVQFIDGVLIFLKEFVTTGISKSGLRQLAENKVIPYLNSNYEGFEIETSLGDPASLKKRAETDESTCYDILEELNIPTESAATNSIVKRLDAVKWFLNRLIDGRGALIIDEKKCPMLKKAFMQKYYFKTIRRIGGDQISDEPIKLHPYSDIMDCLQYITMYCQGIMKEAEKEIIEHDFSIKDKTGW